MSALQSSKLRVAVVGAGYVAGHHLAALKRLDFVELVGICDSNLAAATALAERFGVAMAASNLAELAAQRPQAVYILTPPASHAALAMQALDMGCRVLVEKPMADSIAECRAMIETARSKGLILGVNHSDLLDPVVMKALARVRAGHIGEVVSVDILRSSEYPAYAGGPLPGQVAQGSYPFRDLGVHGLYTLEAFLGKLSDVKVSCQSSGRDPNLQFDEWQAQVRGEQGIGRMLLSWNARPMESRLVVRGTRGVITADRFLQTLHVHRVLPGPKFIGIVINTVLSAAADCVRVPWNVLRFATGMLKPSPGIQKGAADFALAARDNSKPPFDGEAALRIIELLEPACAEPDRLRSEQIESRYQTLAPVDALVTGAAGFLGSKLVRALRARGHSVRVLLRKPNAAFASDSGMQTVIGDLGDPRSVDHAVNGAAVVYHVGAAMKGSVRDFEAGTLWGTRNIIDACARHGSKRLVYVSSMSVFDHAGRDPAQTMTESSAYEPHPDWRGAYTRTKLIAERAVLDAIRDSALPAVILRPGQIFGPGAEKVTPNAVISLAGRWVAVGPGDMSLPLVFVRDVIDALLLAGENPQAIGKVFNIVDTTQVTQQEYLDRAKEKLGDELKVVRVPTGLFMCLGWGVELLGKLLKRDVPLTRYRVRSLRPLANFNVSAARDVLGWKPRVGVARGLDETFGRRS
ncbi:MAG TPA: NAD-dependent epimerase/dehydratase family protein [Dokdonella sp.]|jgi:predicted dehydrogenase/nucleoside-diphosphate-sugar epimerase|uniref:NAD-dependent epimerase/dehydratase family protein n=1 Tax=Dokdonella sp. TaxID=2291710 RepID=UPI001B44D4A2|nr:NAD-dependent epimerase/dehydratase family protein [Dokdonella sp.]MBP6327226.1 NAD-dependent epimerase/dehydratase family protein [Dokdonella sp.]MBP6329502.1 NAD-dependent epimerase/dehydratase family protein [Dokdonella sp.]HNV08205.1 NAD-dependent epimerase/dehydratase family protein [Dokdonella sp.]HPW03826.1 NAD-dependent epimerase/dehydratase family protein [Dokdonella sp.]